MPMQNFVSGLKNNQKGEEKMSRYEEILNSQFKMTDGGRVDYVKDLYTTYCPEVDLQAMIDGGYIDALGDMMEPVLISLDDRSPEVIGLLGEAWNGKRVPWRQQRHELGSIRK